MTKKDNFSEIATKSIELTGAGVVANNQLGSVLQKAREAKKLSVDDVASAIHLSVKQIHALEKNEFSALPDAMITRGFIRNYANFLELDYEPLLKNYRALVPNQEVGSLVVRANVNEVMSQREHQPWLIYILGSILVLLFLMAWFYYMDAMTKTSQGNDGKSSVIETESVTNDLQNQTADSTAVTNMTSQAMVPLAPATDAQNNNAENPATTVMSPVISTNNELSAATNIAAAPQSVAGTTQALNANNSASNNLTVNNVAINTPLTNSQTSTTSVAKKVEFSLSAPSWIRVKDKSGNVIFEKTLPAGSIEGVDGEPPFKVTIGNATAAKVKYLGREVDLVASTSKNVVRLTLE